MSGERKNVVLFDQELTAAAGTVHGPSTRVSGHIINITIENDALGGSATFTLRGGPGKSETHPIIYGENASGLTLLSAIVTTSAQVLGYRVVNPPMWVQVVMVEGASAGRMRVTAVVEVDQN